MVRDQLIKRLVLAFDSKDYSNLTHLELAALVRNRVICNETAKRLLNYKDQQGNL